MTLFLTLVLLASCAPEAHIHGTVFDDLSERANYAAQAIRALLLIDPSPWQVCADFFGYTFLFAGSPRLLWSKYLRFCDVCRYAKLVDSLAAILSPSIQNGTLWSGWPNMSPPFTREIIPRSLEPSMLDAVKTSFGVYAEKSDVSQSSASSIWWTTQRASTHLIPRAI